MSSRPRLTPTGKLLLRACVKGDMTLAQSVLYTDPAALNARNKHGLNTLQVAIIHEQVRMARFLIDKGVNVRSVDKSGWTPLHDAALYGNRELIEKIIAGGSRITSNNQLGEKPIDLAGDVRTEKLLCRCMAEAGFNDLSEHYWKTLGLEYLKDEDVSDTSESERSEEESPLEQGSAEKQAPRRTSRSQNDVITTRETINTANYRSRDFRMSRECHSSTRREAVRVSINTPCGRLASISRDTALSPSFREFRHRRTPLSPLREDRETVPVSGLSETDSPTQRRRPSSPVPRQRRSLVALAGSRSFVRSRSCDESVSNTNGQMHLTPEDIARLNRLFEKSQEVQDHEEAQTPPDRESPVELLKMRPRKPSIVSRERRKERRDSDDVSIASSRRSVTFQPEVLLQEIVTEGDVTVVREMLSSGIVTDVNKMSPVGLTALHQSALDGNLPCAKTLVVNGADVNIVDSDGWTPLHAAAANGHTDIVRYLLLSGSDPTIRTDEGKTPYDLSSRRAIRRMLARASSGSSLDPLTDEISDGEISSEEEQPPDYDSDDEDSSFSDSDHKVSPMAGHTISILGEEPEDSRDSSISPSPIQEPLDNVFSTLHTPSTTTAMDRDPSDSTSSYGSLLEQEGEITVGTPSTLCNEDMLILTGSEREILNSEDQGFSTMDASSDSSHHKITFSDDEGTTHDVLDGDLQPGTLDYRFQEAVLNADVESLMKLAKQRSDINVDRVNKTSGVTALHHSVLEGNFILVQHLVKDFDCNLNLQDVEGWTPLHAASAVGNIRIAQFLLDNGARASILNNNGVFAVDVAEDTAMEALLKRAMLGPLHTRGKLMLKGLVM